MQILDKRFLHIIKLSSLYSKQMSNDNCNIKGIVVG